jgi:hypothetical protein
MSPSFQQLERVMQKVKQRRYRAEEWQKICGDSRRVDWRPRHSVPVNASA